MDRNQTTFEKVQELVAATKTIASSIGAIVSFEDVDAAQADIASNQPTRIVVVGEFNAGKSTLINALCGIALLPTGIIPTTATINVLRYAQYPLITVTYIDGRIEHIDNGPDALKSFTARCGDQSAVHMVEVFLPSAPTGIEFVDTPGVNDINESRSEVVYGMLPRADIVLFVMDAQQALKRSEIDFLRNRVLGSSLAKTIYVLNHCDRLPCVTDAHDVKRVVENGLRDIYGKVSREMRERGCSHIADEIDTYRQSLPIFMVSAKRMLANTASDTTSVADETDQAQELRSELLKYCDPILRNQTALRRVFLQLAFASRAIEAERLIRLQYLSVEKEKVELHLSLIARDLQTQLTTVRHSLGFLNNQMVSLTESTRHRVSTLFHEMTIRLSAPSGNENQIDLLRDAEQALARGFESECERVSSELRQMAETVGNGVTIPGIQSNLRSVNIENESSEPENEDVFGSLLQDPVNQIGISLIAPILLYTMGWVGITIVAIPFLARLLGGISGGVDESKLKQRLTAAENEAISYLIKTITDRIDVIRYHVLNPIDTEQARIRAAMDALYGDNKTNMAILTDTAVKLQSTQRDIDSMTKDVFITQHASGVKRFSGQINGMTGAAQGS